MLPVLAVARVRRELSAYPRSSGPRTLFEIVTPKMRLQLGYRHRERRWSVEGIDSDAGEVALAA